ncbi:MULTISPECIES: maleylacetoacetate isomerase [Cysteiniphilum]|uniref:Glutathione S-transferase n=1 Tax=Cysteiniphilum litorale TaxID=2056700 RepID=A0A8J2Z6Z4_9GAMM|nr:MULTISPECIES: maleylacetoacetate isomerase [Cysteiniphilum]GGG07817.1 glutathione S-transferase [Cysteiniphilum litorale]
MILYDYFRSSASFRVRIALQLKKISYESKEIHLINHGGEQFSSAYKAINPQSRVPALQDGNVIITQSLAIIDYLEDKYPKHSIYPIDPVLKAKVKAFALTIACDIHPLNNSGTLNFLKSEFAANEAHINKWYAHWVQLGFSALEQTLQQTAGMYCFGDEISLADICLIPQVFNAKRFNVDISSFPTIQRIYEHAMKHPAFFNASPEQVMLKEHE